VPTTTGAAIAVTEAIPELKNRFDGMALRVPVITGSITDFTLLLKKKATVDEINEAFIEASKTPRFDGILAVSNDPLVSSDIIGSTFSAIVDLGLTKVVDGDLAKVYAWYDNEWGYANRLVEQIQLVMK
jgi:glyceraldehyde 3-phosphate dehydrogenase